MMFYIHIDGVHFAACDGLRACHEVMQALLRSGYTLERMAVLWEFVRGDKTISQRMQWNVAASTQV